MKKLILVALVVLGLNAGVIKEFDGLSGTLNIAGGTAHINAQKDAIKNIMEDNANVKITLAAGGTGVGIEQVTAKIIDLANTGRAVTKEEAQKGDLQTYRFAIDGIAVIVHKDSPLSNLTTAQLKDIFAGKITNFKELGFSDAPINIYTRDEASATREIFVKNGLEKGEISAIARVVASNAAMKTMIAKDKFSIGIISLGLVDDNLKSIAINGVKPSVESIVKNEYKIARGLYLVSSGKPKPLAKAFIDYMRSEAGAAIVKKHGFIAVNE